MAQLRLFFFGAPRIERAGQPVPLRRSRALALLAYLAVTAQPQDREALLALLWPEFDLDGARNNLRRELSLLRSIVSDELLLADRLQVAWRPEAGAWIDVVAFSSHIAGAQAHLAGGGEPPEAAARALTAAAQLYSDDFLAGFSLPDSPAFDEWQFFQREELRRQLARALPLLSDWHGRRGAYDDALTCARRWLALDPLHEPAQRELMRLYALAGQHAAAMRQYEECVRLLDLELGAPPDPETEALYAAVRARRVAPPAHHPALAASEPRPQPGPPGGSLPAPVSGFVGRERELADLVRRLTDPACRLLTLVGPGGIGKTQLALRAAQVIAEGWSGDEAIGDGVLFVPLAAHGGDELVSALAGAAGFEFYPGPPPAQQLIDYLRPRRMLVLIDGFAHLRGATGFISDLLGAARGLRLLITSREALNIQDEWFHPIDGLSVPDEAADSLSVAQLARFDAIRLFEQHARRFQSSFSLSRERAQVVRLCQLVAGIPLAIELAASWLKMLPADQIVAALGRDLDILTARSRDIPARHRSMRTVLEETWRLLSGDEQAILAGLSVFAGGFSVAAASRICAASLPGLAALVERSLLRVVGDDRFQLHELLRQFAAERLAADGQRDQAAHERHSAAYLDFLAGQAERLAGPAQRAASAAIALEAENVRAAWEWACARRSLGRIDAALGAYHTYLLSRSAFQEGHDRFVQAIAAAEAAPDGPDAPLRERVLARACIRRGVFAHYLGDHATSAQAIERGLALAQRHGLDHDIALAQLIQGVAAGGQGDVARARRLLAAALSSGRARSDSAIIANALYDLASLDGLYGDFAEGKLLAEESVIVSRAAGQIDRTAYALVQLAWLSACRGEYNAAEAAWREALELFQSLGNRYGTALALGGTGYVAWCVGGERLGEAQSQTMRSLELLRTLNHRLSIASRLGDLALIELDLGDYRQAERCSQEGLSLARQIKNTIYSAAHLSILGHIASAEGQFERGRRYLGEALGLSSASGLLPRLAFTCYQVALLAAHEAAALGDAHPRAAARRGDALALLTAIGDYSATPHVYRVRAGIQGEGLRQALPAGLAAAAIARGHQLDLQTDVARLLSPEPPART